MIRLLPKVRFTAWRDWSMSAATILTMASVWGMIWRYRVLRDDAETILSRFGSDDLFYYTQVAHFWVTTGLPSFDGTHVTTGIQPLFTWLLMPFAADFAGEPLLALRVNLGLVSLLTLVLAWSLPGLMRPFLGREWGNWAGAVMGCLWLLHPRLLEVTFQGTEAALAALCWVWSVRFWAGSIGNSRAAFLLGLVLGLGCLARIDQLLLTICLLLWPFERETWSVFARLGWGLLGWLCMVGPWLLFCFWLTGTPFQDSGKAKRLHYQYIHQMQTVAESGTGEADPDWQVKAKYWLARMKAIPMPLLQTGGRLSKISLLGWFGFCLWLAWLWWRRCSEYPSYAGLLLRAGPPVLASFGIIAAYFYRFGYLRVWYYVPVFLMLSMVVAGAWTASWKRFRYRCWFLLAFASWLLLINGMWRNEPRFSWAPIYLKSAEILQAQTPRGARIGAFNAGIQAAVAKSNRRIINLDGVVNHQALVALGNNALVSFVDAAQIQYMIDHRGAVEFYQSLGGPGLIDRLELLATYPVPEQPDQEICLWRVR